MTRLIIGLFLVASTATVFGQDFHYGFKAGLNFNRFHGDLEQNAAGETVEEFDLSTGFHVGAMFSYDITDIFGARVELMYSQKGGRYRFNGEGFQYIRSDQGERLLTTGNKSVSNNITSSYIDLPLMLYVRPVRWLEVSGGVSIGLLAGSTGVGQVRMMEPAGPSGSNVFRVGGNGLPANLDNMEYQFSLQNNYYSDDVDEVSLSSTILLIDGERATLPQTVGGYYDYPAKDDGSYFNLFDFGLNGGLSFFLTESLFIGGRVNYSLGDVTNDNYDYSQVQVPELGELVSREDKDGHLSFQASVGFSF
jgi:hypothetical protein